MLERFFYVLPIMTKTLLSSIHITSYIRIWDVLLQRWWDSFRCQFAPFPGIGQCFFGGTYAAFFAAAEAFKTSGGDQVQWPRDFSSATW